MVLSPDDVRAELSLQISVEGSRRVDALTESQLQRRQAIVDSAVEAAAVGGFHDVHMRDIAEIAGISMSTLYHYFPSKVHLLATALGNELSQFDEYLDRNLGGTLGAFARLRVVVDSLIDAMERSNRITEALTHAYVASFITASAEAQAVHDQTSQLFAQAMSKDSPSSTYLECATLLADVWTSEILALVQERRDFADIRHILGTTIDLLHRSLSTPTATAHEQVEDDAQQTPHQADHGLMYSPAAQRQRA